MGAGLWKSVRQARGMLEKGFIHLNKALNSAFFMNSPCLAYRTALLTITATGGFAREVNWSAESR